MNSTEQESASCQISATTPGGGGGGEQGTEVATAEVTLDAAPNPVPEGTWARVTTTLSPTLNEHVTISLTVTRVSSDDGDHSTLASVTVTAGNATAVSTATTTQDTDRDDEAFTVGVDTANLPSNATAGNPISKTVSITGTTHEEGTSQTQVIVFFPAAPTGLSAQAGNARVVLTWDTYGNDFGNEVSSTTVPLGRLPPASAAAPLRTPSRGQPTARPTPSR